MRILKGVNTGLMKRGGNLLASNWANIAKMTIVLIRVRKYERVYNLSGIASRTVPSSEKGVSRRDW